ncbi:hypothetical protein LCGC14_2522950, partial [marine sediment metagenome]
MTDTPFEAIIKWRDETVRLKII